MSAIKFSKSGRQNNYLKSFIRQGVDNTDGLSLGLGFIGEGTGIYYGSPWEF